MAGRRVVASAALLSAMLSMLGGCVSQVQLANDKGQTAPMQRCRREPRQLGGRRGGAERLHRPLQGPGLSPGRPPCSTGVAMDHWPDKDHRQGASEPVQHLWRRLGRRVHWSADAASLHIGRDGSGFNRQSITAPGAAEIRSSSEFAAGIFRRPH